MIAIGTRAHGQARRRALKLKDGMHYFKGEWLESGEDPALSPTVFLIEQEANSTLPTHFHRQNEFQLVVGGSGAIGRHAMRPFALHYAGAYTGYGPVVAGPEGLDYFTIRPVFDTGALMASEARDKMIRGPKRQVHAAPFSLSDPERLRQLGAVERVDVIPTQDDAMFAEVLRIPPGMTVTAKHVAGGGGVFHFVLAGTLHYGDAALTPLEHVFASAGEAPLAFTAGPGGAEMLSMQTPVTAAAYLPKEADVPEMQ